MIQKGIIAQVIDKYNYKVRIPKYDKVESATYSTKTDDLSSGIVCSVPGIEVVYVEGDVVLLSFENGELSKPVILGLLYREEKKDSDILVNSVDTSLSGIKEDIDKLNSQSLYTHLKYSDDNGITFTSLFSSQNYESIVGGEVVCQPYFDDESTIGIEIDKVTKAISWSILDENNQDITDEIEIETIVFDSNKNIIKRYRSRDNRLITINNSSQIDGDLYLTYRIFTSKAYLDTLHIRLSSDKEPFGVRVGDYVGLYLSFDSTPSTTPSDYSWFPIASGAAIDAEINRKIAALTAEMAELLNDFKEEVDENFVTIFYRDVDWTQAQVDTYCQPGYEGTWERDPISGYMDEVKTGNTLYISVHNTGESDSTSDDSYGQLQIRATTDAAAGQDVEGSVIAYIVSGEIALDALARFKSSLLQPGDETLIYGGHITTGRISDSSGKNFIQLSAEERAPAGQVEFKNQDTWASSNQGLQWDSNQGQLNIKGNINASSLTIISGNSSYDGAAAINISGYDIEIIKDSVDVEEDVSVYLYPILYHNGTKVPDNEVDWTNFLWYEDDSTTGAHGGTQAERGRYLATYGHVYRVTYDFDDGAVGGGTEVQTRYVDPEKYITKVNDYDITIHPESYQNVSSYIQLNQNGLNVFNSDGNSIAQYGSTARVGLNNSSRFLINSGSLQAYDNNNVKYFEVSNGDLSWGDNTAATTAQLAGKANTSDIPTSVTDLSDGADYSTTSQMNSAIGTAVGNLSTSIEDAAKTATNYITTISGGGIKVHDEDDDENYAKIDADGLEVYRGINGIPKSIAKFGGTTRIGKATNASKVTIQDNELSMYTNDGTITFNSSIPTDADALEQNIIKKYENETYPLDGVTIEDSSTYISTNTFTISDITAISSNTTFKLNIFFEAYSRWDGATVTHSFSFIKSGSPQTMYASGTTFAQIHEQGVDIDGIDYNVTVQYNGVNNFTVTLSAHTHDSEDGTMYEMYGYISSLEYRLEIPPAPSTRINGDFYANGTNIGSTYIMGPNYCQKGILSNANIYLGNDYHTIDIDQELNSMINTLTWDDDVIISIFINTSSVSHHVGETFTVTPQTSPADAQVYWLSSNTDVATITAEGMITTLSAGSTIITAYMYVDDFILSTTDTLYVEA